jgi:hypothetical protein
VTPTPTITPTSTFTPPSPTATPVPPLTVRPSALTAGQAFSVYMALADGITQPFDFYLFADSPAGIYTIYLNGNVQKGLAALYKNVPSFKAPYITTIRPSVKLPAGMQGQTITFYGVVVQAGKMPPVQKPSDLTPTTQYVIYLGKNAAVVN